MNEIADSLEEIRDVLYGMAALLSWVITAAGLYLLHKSGALERVFNV